MTVNVTGTVMLEAPIALRVIFPVWLPAVRIPVVALTVTAPLPVPEAGEAASQVVSGLALQLKVPPPVLLMLTVWVAGLAPPWVAAKERLVELAPIAGDRGAGGAGAGGGGDDDTGLMS